MNPVLGKQKIARMSDSEALELMYNWSFWARPNQIPPSGVDWNTWLICTGRGWGKTRTGAEWVRWLAESGKFGRIALVGATAADVRDIMIEGDSGIKAICPPWNYPNYEPSKRRLTWPNGVRAIAYSAEEPARLRGPQHHAAWADELASWKYPETYDMLLLGLRLGVKPRVVVTTTPKPIKIIRELVKDDTTTVTTGSTFENRANLAKTFLNEVTKKYEGTRLGRQELYAEILEDVEGALWNRDMLESVRVSTVPDMKRIVVAVDPSVSNNENSAETGIIVVGLGVDGNGYIIDDKSMVGSPDEWSSEVIALYNKHKADRIVVEVNQGGDLVETVLRTKFTRAPIKKVHASRGKQTRAEPVVALYEQKRVKHIGFFPFLEDQLCSWIPGVSKSPDRMDALVWGITSLMLENEPTLRVRRL